MNLALVFSFHILLNYILALRLPCDTEPESSNFLQDQKPQHDSASTSNSHFMNKIIYSWEDEVPI